MSLVLERVARGLARRAGLRAFRFFRRELDPAASASAPAGLEIRALAEREVAPLCRRDALNLRPETVSAAYARGDFCAAAYESGELVGYCWLAFAPLPHLDGVWVGFSEEAAWTYKSFVLPSHRGRGIAPALYRFADRLCAERGRAFSILCTEAHNRPSVSASLRGGYAPAGHAAYLHPGKSLLAWMSPGARRLGVRFFVPAARNAPA